MILSRRAFPAPGQIAPMVRGHLEPLSAVLRIGGSYGEPYTWSASVRYLTPTEIELMGIGRAPTVTERRNIRSVLKAAGIRVVRFARRHGQQTLDRRYHVDRAVRVKS